MAEKKILVIEDERDIADVIAFNLGRDGFAVVTASSGEEGLKAAKGKSPHLIVLDIMLPGMSGLDVCRILKQDAATRGIPIIILTARNEDIEIVTGLEVGADDYITKPFSPKVLAARIRAVLRRREAAGPEIGSSQIRLGDLLIDPTRRRVTADDDDVDLTFTEFELLSLLARRPGWVFSRSQLIDALREGEHVITDRAIDVQIANLRRKLGRCSHYVQTVRGVGYRITEAP